MMIAVHMLAAIGLLVIFKTVSDSFYCGWFGGGVCMGMLRYLDWVLA